MSIGIDVELSTDLEERLWDLVLRPEEIAWIQTPGELGAGARAKLLFSAKECVYKCQYPRLGLALDFTDIEIGVDEAAREFSVRWASVAPDRLCGLTGRYRFDGSTVMTGMACRPAQ